MNDFAPDAADKEVQVKMKARNFSAAVRSLLWKRHESDRGVTATSVSRVHLRHDPCLFFARSARVIF
jgi:hypothetical protein